MSLSTKETEIKILENVDTMILSEDKNSIIIKTLDNKLYILKNSENGMMESSDILKNYENLEYIAENVKTFEKIYFITEDNELYTYGIINYNPNYITNNIKSVELIYDYYNEYDFKITTINDEKQILKIYKVYDEENDLYNIVIENAEEYYTEQEMQILYKTIKVEDNLLMITTDGKMYNFKDEKMEILSGVKNIITPNFSDIDGSYILKEDGTLVYYCNANYCYKDSLMLSLDMAPEGYDGRSDYIEGHKIYDVINNVENIEDIHNYFIYGKNNEVYRFGNDDNNLFNNEEYIDNEYHFIQIDEINYNDSNVTPLLMKIIENQTGKIGDTENIQYKCIPNNATFNEVIFTSSDTNVAEIVSDEITYLSAGTTEVCGIMDNNDDLSDCKTYTIYENIKSISFEQETYDLVLDEQSWMDIHFEYTPQDVPYSFLDLEITSTNEEYINIYVNEYSPILEVNIWEPGTYDITIKQRGCNTEECTDTIKINAIKLIERIEFDMPESNYDGIKNVFIYLDKSNQLQSNFKVYPENATDKSIYWVNFNPEIVTIDENGLITAHKSGKAEIQVYSNDWNTPGTARVYTNFNVIVYENSNDGKIGDLNKDNNVDILDLIKLRGYLAELDE